MLFKRASSGVFTNKGGQYGGGGGGGGKKNPPKNLSHISYNDKTWHSCILPKEYISKKYKNHVTHSFSPSNISTSSLEINNFCYIEEYKSGFHFDT